MTDIPDGVPDLKATAKTIKAIQRIFSRVPKIAAAIRKGQP